MGGCASCMRIILETESDVKINVIEPTTIMNEGISVVMPPQQSDKRPSTGKKEGKLTQVVEPQPNQGFLLTVPTPHPIVSKKHLAAA